jgi:hypothetical protein
MGFERQMPRLGEILVAVGDCTPQHVAQALENQLVYDGRIGTNLLELGAVTEEQLAGALAMQQGVPATFGDVAVEAAALAVLDAERAQRWQAVPYRLHRRRLDVLLADARDPRRLDEMSFALGKDVRPVLVSEWRLWQLLHTHYAVPFPPRRARGSTVGRVEDEGLTPIQDLLAELQSEASVRAARDAQAAAAGPLVADRAFVSDAQWMAEQQDDATRQYWPELVAAGRTRR